MSVDLAKVDQVRDRMRCTYQEAITALEQTQGDVVLALAHIEQRQNAGGDLGNLAVELLDDVQRLLEAGGAIRQVRVRIGDRVVREFPLDVTPITAIVVGVMAVLASRLTIELIRD